MSDADKDYASTAVRAELRRLHEAAVSGSWGTSGALVDPRFEAVTEHLGEHPPGVRLLRTESAGQKRWHTDLVATCPAASVKFNPSGRPFGAECYSDLIADALNALPHLLTALDARDALLRQCVWALTEARESLNSASGRWMPAEDVLANLAAAGFTTEDK